MFDIIDMEDEDRTAVLSLGEAQMQDVAKFCNRYPNIDFTYDIADKDNIRRYFRKGGVKVFSHVGVNHLGGLWYSVTIGLIT